MPTSFLTVNSKFFSAVEVHHLYKQLTQRFSKYFSWEVFIGQKINRVGKGKDKESNATDQAGDREDDDSEDREADDSEVE